MSLSSLPETSVVPPCCYREEIVPITARPLDLATSISQACGSACYTVYEREEEWSIGLDAKWTLNIDTHGVVRSSDGARWQHPRPCQAIAEALQQLPIEDWRVYGRALFEFSYLNYGIEPIPAREPLFTLIVPRSEIRLCKSRALIRCLEPNELSTLIALVQRLDKGCPTLPVGRRLTAMHRTKAAKAHYHAQVSAALSEIHAKDYQKVILSRPIDLPAELDLPISYLRGRASNTPVRSFLLRDGNFQCYGFSPETVVEVDAKGMVSTQPLAGTRALMGDHDKDANLRHELLNDTKEVAEHAVSVKLAMDEMRSICAPESISLTDFMSVRPRGSVQHLSSRVHGRLAEGCNAWDAFESLFPAVTASGIPKREAIDSIRRHEPHPRYLYSGCVMTADSAGNLDAALVLRSVFRRDAACWLQVGAGIVSMSTPDREWEESCDKVDSIIQYLYTSQ